MVDYKHADLFLQDSTEKQIKITYGNTTITNEDLFNQEMTLDESLCSSNELSFGACEASVIKFKVANIVAPMKGQWLNVNMILDGNADLPFHVGKYKVESDVLTADRRWREITAYDAMYDIINSDVSEWYESVLPDKNSSMSLREFRRRFVEHFGLKEKPADLINDDMVVKKTLSTVSSGTDETGETIQEGATLSGKDVINCICEINARFGHIGRDGMFHYIKLPQEIQGLYPANNLYPSDDLYPKDPKSHRVTRNHYISCKYEDFLTKSITQLQIRQEENDIGLIVGVNGNPYIIQGNFLLYGKTQNELLSISQRILEKIKGIIYRPFSAECKGNLCLEVGDPVRLSTEYDIVESYILKRTMKGIQSLKDSYSSTGVERYSEKVNSVHQDIRQIKGKANILSRTIDETNSRITDVEQGLQSQITQNASSITAEVIRATEEEGNLSSRISMTESSITAEVIRATGAEQEIGSRIEMTESSILSTVANSSQIWYEGGLTVNYRGYGNPEGQYPATSENYGKKYLDVATGKLYICTRLNSGKYIWAFETGLSRVTKELNSKIDQTAESITSTVSATYETKQNADLSYKSLSSQIDQTAESITSTVSATYETKSHSQTRYTELSSSIEQTAESISSKVSKGDVVSEINQSAEQIVLSAGRLVIESGNFTLDEGGNASMTGHVVATSGKIGHFDITSEGLSWEDYGTKIWGTAIYTNYVEPIGSIGNVRIGGGGGVDIGVWGSDISTLYCSGGICIPFDHYLRLNRDGPSIIGWSSAEPNGNLHIGDYNRQNLPNEVIINSKKITVLNSAGNGISHVDNTSDEREKNILGNVSNPVEFVRALKPIVYQYKDEDDPVTHWGFGAQTTLAAIKKSNIGECRLIERNSYDLGRPIDPEDDSTFFYSMKYDEMIAPIVGALQYALNEIDKLKKEV